MKLVYNPTKKINKYYDTIFSMKLRKIKEKKWVGKGLKKYKIFFNKLWCMNVTIAIYIPY